MKIEFISMFLYLITLVVLMYCLYKNQRLLRIAFVNFYSRQNTCVVSTLFAASVIFLAGFISAVFIPSFTVRISFGFIMMIFTAIWITCVYNTARLARNDSDGF